MESLMQYLPGIRATIKSIIWDYHCSVLKIREGIILASLIGMDSTYAGVKRMFRAVREIREEKYWWNNRDFAEL